LKQQTRFNSHSHPYLVWIRVGCCSPLHLSAAAQQPVNKIKLVTEIIILCI
jgi:hypothetical protein